MDNDRKERAMKVFNNVCKAFDTHGWHYEKNASELEIESGARGEDLPIPIRFRIDEDRQLALLISILPFEVPEDKRLELAIATTMVNNKLVDGSFDYDISTGHMLFRVTSSFIDSEVGEEAFSYMLFCACKTIDDFNDKFLMLSTGMITVEKFMEIC